MMVVGSNCKHGFIIWVVYRGDEGGVVVVGVDIVCGDCLDVLRGMGSGSIEAVVTDPPYGLSDHKLGDVEACLAAWLRGEEFIPSGLGGGFMGKSWDAWVPGPEVWREVYRVMKPGAFIACFASTRTADLMSMALRLAGFRKHTDILYAYGSGFPKATDLSKQIDKQAGAVRDVVGNYKISGLTPNRANFGANDRSNGQGMGFRSGDINITAPATEAAKEWDGFAYGLQALKPAVEPILLFQKPYEGKAVDSILKHGCGALDIDGSRVGTDGGTAKGSFPKGKSNGVYGDGINGACEIVSLQAGRWPANLILQADCPEVLACFPERKTTWVSKTHKNNRAGEFLCELRHPGNQGFNDQGSASRFFKQVEITDEDRRIFYTAKPSKRERDMGCDGLEAKVCQSGMGDAIPIDDNGNERDRFKTISRNHHATVKPLSLMEYLVKLISREGQTVLDPFMGSGTTGMACVKLGRNFVGIEREEEYVLIARARIAAAASSLGQGAVFSGGGEVCEEVVVGKRVMRQMGLFE